MRHAHERTPGTHMAVSAHRPQVARMAHATLGIGVTETAGLIGYAPYLGARVLGRDA